jgi:hypothetical protein
MFKKVDSSNVKPCHHMETLVSAYVDGNLTGIKCWYTESHIKGCKQCQASIPFLQALRARTLTMASDGAPDGVPDGTGAAPILGEERWEKIESSWNEADNTAKP